MFAYCLNNPIIFSDRAGTIAGVDDIIFLGGVFCCTLIFGAAIAPVAWDAAVAVTDYIVGAVNEQLEVFGDIYDSISGVISEYITQEEQIGDKLTKSFENAKVREYKYQTEVHHIVAKASPYAVQARTILQKVGIVIDSELNKIRIKTGLHRRLHTQIYYEMVNAAIINAYDNGEGSFYEQRSRVIAALQSLKGFIGGLNILSPY